MHLDPYFIEQEAAAKIGQFVRREFGLCPREAVADLHGAHLTVRLTRALTPLGRAVIRREGGGAVVQGVYDVLHEVSHEPMEALVARIVGVPVRQSHIAVDSLAEDVVIEFDLHQ